MHMPAPATTMATAWACPICFESDADRITGGKVAMVCGHDLCLTCSIEIVKASTGTALCPLCREPFYKPDTPKRHAETPLDELPAQRPRMFSVMREAHRADSPTPHSLVVRIIDMPEEDDIPGRSDDAEEMLRGFMLRDFVDRLNARLRPSYRSRARDHG